MIHEKSCVHPNAKIGEKVKVNPFSMIHENVEIGSGTWIGSNVTIMDGARIGKNCKIFPGAVISAIPQDLKFDGENSLAIIDDNTTIRECATVNRGTKATGKTLVGKNCLIMAYTHIAHDCKIGDHCIIVNNVAMGGHVEIGKYAIVGGLSAIHQFVSIGEHSMISGGALVRKDIPPYIKVANEPLTFIGINSIGLKRRGFKMKKINEIHDIYRQFFQKEQNTSQALKIVKSKFDATFERDLIINFIEKSKRGLVKKK